jgi:protein SPT2
MGNINTASSRPNDRPNGASARNDNGTTAVKKRKLDNLSENLQLTETDKERAERKRKLQEKLKMKKEKIAGGLSGPTNAAPPAPPTGSARLSASAASKASAPAPSTSTNSLAKLSYQELLARAAKLREEKKIPGGITHKARAPVTEKKEWQKKLARQQQQAAGGSVADRKSKSPGVISGSERSTLAKKAVGKDMGKAGPAKKAGNTTERGLTSVIKGKASDKSRPAEPPVKRKRSPSPISWRGRNAAATTTKKASRPRPGRSRYDEEDEEDDWIVDDDEDDGGGYSRRYGPQLFSMTGLVC